jgi:hypothetical protein
MQHSHWDGQVQALSPATDKQLLAVRCRNLKPSVLVTHHVQGVAARDSHPITHQPYLQTPCEYSVPRSATHTAKLLNARLDALICAGVTCHRSQPHLRIAVSRGRA